LNPLKTPPRKETEEVLEWLRGGPSLTELKARFPAEWEAVSDELAAIFASGKPEQLQAYMTGLATPLAAQPNRVGQRPNQQTGHGVKVTLYQRASPQGDRASATVHLSCNT